MNIQVHIVTNGPKGTHIAEKSTLPMELKVHITSGKTALSVEKDSHLFQSFSFWSTLAIPSEARCCTTRKFKMYVVCIDSGAYPCTHLAATTACFRVQ